MRTASPESSRPSRIRILLATHGVDDQSWDDWQIGATGERSRIPDRVAASHSQR